MKALKTNQMENTQGGSFWGAFCGGAAIAVLLIPNPISVGVGIGCALWGIFGE